MTTLELRSDTNEGISCPEYLRDDESSSIYPLLTPSASAAKLLCPSPDFPADGALLMAQGFMQDPESSSICPLLQSSPPTEMFRHPLDSLGALPFAQASVDSELPGYVGLNQARDSRSSSIPETIDLQLSKRGSVSNNLLETSSSSSSSALQDTPSCAQLLNHHYQHLNMSEKKELGQFITQENGTTLEIAGSKIPTDYCFIHWNWPVIRTSCFWSVLTLTVACICVVIGMIATVPTKCYPKHEWYQGAVFYEIFPASFQDSEHDGIGDLRGLVGRTSYFVSLGITAIRLNSIFASKDYPEAYQDINNLTSLDSRLGTFSDMDHLISTLHKQNISVILDLPIYPLVKSLGVLKVSQGKSNAPLRKDNIADKITNTVHNHRSHRDVNESQANPAMLLADKSEFAEKKLTLNPYIDGGISGLMKVTSEHLRSISRTTVEEAIHFWFKRGIDGIYIKGLENYLNDSLFEKELRNWNKIKNLYSDTRRKVLMTEYSVVENSIDANQKSQIFETFDLLDVFLDLSVNSSGITSQISKYLGEEVFKDANNPTIHWNIGNVGTTRLADRVNNNLGSIVFQSLLPGTISIFYGDEMSMSNSLDPHGDHKDSSDQHQLIPMRWVNDMQQFTVGSMMPWLPYGQADSDSVNAKAIIRNITDMRRITPSVYMNRIIKDEKILLNTVTRYNDETINSLERFYPRRNTYVVIYNSGSSTVRRDMSRIYYGGEIVQDVEGNIGKYVEFKEFVLQAGDAVIVKLDN